MAGEIEPYEMTVLAKKFESITREMTQSLLRSARSAVINVARDFSSGITLYDGRTFMIDEGIPVHLANIHLHPEYTLEHFDDIKPGDLFLTNSPYAGNTHHADYTLYAPVFFEDEPLFWVINRAHQADVGAPEPTTYLENAATIFEEGPHFPAIRVQEEYEDKDDLIRMLKLNIRAGDTQWYGDYLAQVSAVRAGEAALEELVAEYGREVIGAFTDEWIAYGERMMRSEIAGLPAATVEYETKHDPIYVNDAAPDGVPINVQLEIDPDAERIRVDLTDNIENIPAGVNLSEATVIGSTYGAIYTNLDPDLPHNHGATSRIEIAMDEGKVIGKPRYPVGTSCATSNVNDMFFNAVQAVFGEVGEPYGFGETNSAMPPNWGVIAGHDPRRDEPYANQVFFTAGGGGASYGNDGWITHGTPDVCGVLYRDSVEIDEQKYPILVRRNELVPDTEGAGEWRGTPAGDVEYGPRKAPMTVAFHGTGYDFPPKGIRGGGAGAAARVWKRAQDGELMEVASPGVGELEPGEFIVGRIPGGGGYGDPLDRDPGAVRADVEKGYLSVERARDVYGVVLEHTDDGISVNASETENERARRQAGGER